jgi:hypothetical protein
MVFAKKSHAQYSQISNLNSISNDRLHDLFILETFLLIGCEHKHKQKKSKGVFGTALQTLLWNSSTNSTVE